MPLDPGRDGVRLGTASGTVWWTIGTEDAHHRGGIPGKEAMGDAMVVLFLAAVMPDDDFHRRGKDHFHKHQKDVDDAGE